jgi:class 3 adenylate cyclase
MEETGDLLGTVINMAARVTSEAQPAEVLVTEAVADQLDGRFELADRGVRTLKGRPGLATFSPSTGPTDRIVVTSGPRRVGSRPC